MPARIGLRAEDVGETLVSACLGALAIAMLAVGYRRTSRRSRSHLNGLLYLLVALTFLAVALDLVHALFAGSQTGLTIVEDGGEQVVLSATVAYVLWIALLTREPRQEDAAATASR